MQIEPYLFFEGRCEEALEFYRKSLGAEVVMISRFGDAPPGNGMQPPPPPDKVMHCTLRIGKSQIMASDGHCSGKTSFGGFSLALSPANEAEAKKAFDALADGGEITMPLAKTFFSPAFGMLVDRFGLGWMVHVGQ
jgi:PhnB protein